jgi:hypothetical protein
MWVMLSPQSPLVQSLSPRGARECVGSMYEEGAHITVGDCEF